MTVTIPIEFNQELIDELVQLTLKKLEEKEHLHHTEINELPPYPTRKQLKQLLKIGDTRINSWIDHGLQTIPFGKETRFDREDVKQFLNDLKT